MNSINLIGRLTRQPELDQTKGGTAVCRMRLAVPRRKKDGKDQGAVFVNVVAYGGLAGSCADYLSRGRQVAVSGRLEYREWEGADGSLHSMHEVVAEPGPLPRPAQRRRLGGAPRGPVRRVLAGRGGSGAFITPDLFARSRVGGATEVRRLGPSQHPAGPLPPSISMWQPSSSLRHPLARDRGNGTRTPSRS